MSKLTAKQVREKLTKLLGSDLIAEGVDPTTAMGGVLEIIDSYELMETEQTTHATQLSDLESTITDYKGKLLTAQEHNLKLLKKVDNSGTMGVGNDNDNDDSVMTVDKLLFENNKED